MSNKDSKNDPRRQIPSSEPWTPMAAQEAMGAIPDNLEWQDSDLLRRGDPEEDSSYVDGFNDGIAHARHVARHLRIAMEEISRLGTELEREEREVGVRIRLDEQDISLLRKASIGKHQNASARDLLSRIVAAGLAGSKDRSDAMAIRCPVHDGTLHGAEAEELRAGIESLIDGGPGMSRITSSSHDALEELIGGLRTLLDRVNESDSLAHLETIDNLSAEVARLKTRRDELLALVAKLTRETPYPAELDECRSARRALIAEVGTLRARLRGDEAP